jgi:putative ABC transport system permease protein
LNATVSGNLFSVLGVAPMYGRTLSVDDEAGAQSVAVISHSLWQRRFGSDSAVVGKVLPVEGAGKDGTGALRIIGVMPAGFYFPNKGTEYWTPSTKYWRFRRESTERFPQWARRWIGVARLDPNASMEAARADLARVGQRLSQLYRSDIPDFPGFETNVVPMLDSVAGKNLQSALWLLLGSVFLVLLVACANVANLLLARGAGRQHEFALRGALGAGRARLARQLVVESLVLASLGGAIGIMVAALGTRLLGVAAAAQVPRIDEVTVDGRVLAFAALLSLVAGVVFGVAPAARVWATDVSEILKEGSRSSGGRRLRRTRGLLVVAECAMAIMLLAGAGLLIRSLDRLRSTDPGFDPAHVLNVRVEFPPRAPSQTPDVTRLDEVRSAMAHSQILATAIARLENAPGVEAVGFIDDMFIAAQGHASITIPGRGDSLNTGELTDGAVTPGFFKAMRVSLRRGRLLEPTDGLTKIQAIWAPIVTTLSLAEKERAAVPEPVVVNEAFVRRFFPAEDPIGKRFCIDPTNKTYWYVIVGVIGNMHRQGLDRDAIPEYLGPLVPTPNSRMDLFVRTKGDPIALAPTVRQLITSSIPGSLIVSVARTDQLLDGMSASRALQTWLLTAFAALALVLAAVGIYGVVHYAVAERTREMGVRVALGAAAPDVLRLVVVQGMRLPVIGIALGIVAALAVSRTMAHLLFGTRPTDPMTYVGVALTLAAVALGACIVPARRAARVDPVVALRAE